MRQVKVDSLDVRVFPNDHVDGSTNSSTNINENLEIGETFVGLEDLLGDDGGVVPHPLIEHLVKSGIGSMVLECTHTVGLVEWHASI